LSAESARSLGQPSPRLASAPGYGTTATATIGRAGGRAPSEPWNPSGVPEKPKIPPSEATVAPLHDQVDLTLAASRSEVKHTSLGSLGEDPDARCDKFA
jgi:hypothetical protein